MVQSTFYPRPEKGWHGAFVKCNQNTLVLGRPLQNIRVEASEWKFLQITHTNCVNRMDSESVVTFDQVPQSSTKIFVK